MSDETSSIKIRFEDVTIAEAGGLAASLREDLLDISPDIGVRIEKDDPSTQDFGATLVLVLGTPAVLAVAKGVADYLRRKRGTITIEKDGTLVATGISGDDAARIAEAFSQKD